MFINKSDPPPPEQCITSYSTTTENFKLLIQLCWLIPSAVFQAKVIYVMTLKNPEKFRKQSFFTIFLADCATGFILTLFSIFFSRPLMFLPQFCTSISEFLTNHTLIMDIYYPFFRYIQAIQILLQTLLITNRASCVLMPTKYAQFWKKWLKWAMISVGVFPSCWLWNLVISDKAIRHAYGGIFISYNRWAKWARTSLFFATLRAVSIVIIIMSTVSTFWRMSKLKSKLMESERKLCFASVFMSICYTIPAIMEFRHFQISSTITPANIEYALLIISWDIQNVSSTFILLIASPPFRQFVFGKNGNHSKDSKKTAKKSISIATQVIKVTSLSH